MLELAEDARSGRIDVLIVSKTNPVFALPAAAGFKEALARIPLIVSLSSFMDETTALADLILPSHTYLESWGDDFPEPGVGFPVGAIAQPVVSPLYDTRATGDIILESRATARSRRRAALDEHGGLSQAGLARDSSARRADDSDAEGFETFWTSVLQAGVWGQDAHRSAHAIAGAPRVIDGHQRRSAAVFRSERCVSLLPASVSVDGLHDGRGANLPWMQELPDPLTSVVYGSWVELNPVTAKQLGVDRRGRRRCGIHARSHQRPGLRLSGHPARRRRHADRAGTWRVRPLRAAPRCQSDSDPGAEIEPSTGALAWSATRVKLVPTGRRVQLLKTDGTARELGRDIVRTTATASARITARSSTTFRSRWCPHDLPQQRNQANPNAACARSGGNTASPATTRNSTTPGP